MSEIMVLCVENHPEYMDALKYVLERAGYEVTPATTGDQALRLLTTMHVGGVLLEYDLPDATGSAVRAEMKRIKPDVPVLMFAGLAVKHRSCFAFLRLISGILRGPIPFFATWTDSFNDCCRSVESD
jgi:CheY-like chemotaxis protein